VPTTSRSSRPTNESGDNSGGNKANTAAKAPSGAMTFLRKPSDVEILVTLCGRLPQSSKERCFRNSIPVSYHGVAPRWLGFVQSLQLHELASGRADFRSTSCASSVTLSNSNVRVSSILATHSIATDPLPS
jgi:hypothetical protein